MNEKSYSQEPGIIIDLREELPIIRDQETRPICLAFAASDAHSNFQGFKKPLSVEFLTFHAYKADGHQDYSSGLSINAAISVLKNEGQPCEADWPYKPLQANPIKPPLGLSPIYNVDCRANMTFSTTDLTKVLDSRRSIVIIVEITNSFYLSIDHPHIIDDQGPSIALHAMVLVGYGKLSSGEILFLARNSWGEAWAKNGHSWLTENYISNKMTTYITLN